MKHGTRTGYDYHRCRCDECVRCHRDHMASLKDGPIPARSQHGTFSTYNNYGCRCELCTAANAEKSRRWSAAHPDDWRRYKMHACVDCGSATSGKRCRRCHSGYAGRIGALARRGVEA